MISGVFLTLIKILNILQICIIDCIKINPAVHERLKHPLPTIIPKDSLFQGQVQDLSKSLIYRRDADSGMNEVSVPLTSS